MPIHIAAEEGYFADEGLDVEPVSLTRIQDLMVGLARDDVDVAAGMVTINILSSIAAGSRIRFVGELGYLASGHCAFNALVARRQLVDSGAMEDPGRLTSLRWDADALLPYGYWLDRAVNPYGLGIGDLDLVNLPEAAAVEAVRNGSIDVTLVSEPYLSMLTASPEAAIWKTSADLVPDYPISVVMYGPDLLDERPEVGERFARALLRAMRRFGEGKTPRNLEIIQRASGLTDTQVRDACWPAARPDGRLDPQALAGYQQWAVTQGYVDRVLGDDEIAAPEIFARAAAALDGN